MGSLRHRLSLEEELDGGVHRRHAAVEAGIASDLPLRGRHFDVESFLSWKEKGQGFQYKFHYIDEKNNARDYLK